MAQDNKFFAVLTLAILVSSTFLGILVITKLYDNPNPTGIWTPSRTINSPGNNTAGTFYNISNYMVFTSGSTVSNLTNNTWKVIRQSPAATFTCNRVYVQDAYPRNKPVRLNINSTNNSVIRPGQSATFGGVAQCDSSGRMRFLLRGSAANSTSLHYNLSYSAGAWDAVYNVSVNSALGNAAFANQSGWVYLLIIFVIVIAVVGGYLGFKGGMDGGIEGGSFNMGNPLSHFRKD